MNASSRSEWCRALLIVALSSGCTCGLVPVVEGGEDGGAPPDDGGTVSVDTDGGAGDGGVFDGGMTGAACSVASAPCYSAAASTVGQGACRAGVTQCLNNVFGACTGEVTPSAEACNGVDDDCNGTVDDVAALGTVTCGVGACKVTVPACTAGAPTTCTPGTPGVEAAACDGIDNDCDGAIDEDGCACVYVATTGLDSNPGTAAAPKRTITAAIATAVSTGPSQVCVATVCPAGSTFNEAVVMANGVPVYGGYTAAATLWPRTATCATIITAVNAKGVLFNNTVVSPTTLDGFTIRATNDPTNAAVTIEGSTGASLSNNTITAGAGQTSIGVDIVDATVKATPTLSSNTIVGGSGSVATIGVRSTRSAPVIQGNCHGTDAQGRCITACGNGRFILGHNAGIAPGQQPASSYGIQLIDSPGALVAQNGICSAGSTGDSAGVRVTGDATGTIVRTSTIVAANGTQNSVGVWFDACAAAAPWVFNNVSIGGNAGAPNGLSDGVRAVGDCHPVIDSNVRIVGGYEGQTSATRGVLCARDTVSGVSSRCTILNNALIQGSGQGFPPTSTGVRCETGACARIENNMFITATAGARPTGVSLQATGTFINNNHIESGCATQGPSVGLELSDAFARVQNNVIEGVPLRCNTGNGSAVSVGTLISLGASGNEVDLHSNTVRSGTSLSSCRALQFGVAAGAAVTAGRGIVRNNLLFAGTCTAKYVVEETAASSDPRVFENNDLWSTGASPILYRDEATTDVTGLGTLNGLTDMTVSSNIASDPLVTTGVHLGASSPCRNAGTDAGVPSTDMDGQRRPNEGIPDIGADEFYP